MDPLDKRNFGDSLTFHGGIDVQTTLATGSVEISWRKSRNGWMSSAKAEDILSPLTAYGAGPSVDKILAMYQRAQKTI